MRLAPNADLVSCHAFDDVFDTVASGGADYGVVPVENSIGGSIHRNYDLLVQHDLSIVAEIELQIVHQLLARPGVSLGSIRRVFSHPQALAQCERFLRKLDRVEIVATYNTAGSAKLIADGRLDDTAAIASARAGRLFGLSSLAEGIQDFDNNVTRFVVVGRVPLTDAAPDKTAIVFSVPNQPGMLFTALSAFALRGIDLTKLESRPIPGKPWEYLFYADVGAGTADDACAQALQQLGQCAQSIRVLGSFPRWKGDPTG